jgi:cell division septation protein DedD
VEQDKPAIAEKPAPEDSKPAQTAQTSRETRPTEQSKPAAEKPAVESASAKQVAPVAKGWWVQLGSFASRDNADRLARQLRTSGFPLEVSRIRAQGKELYRVRAGPVKDRAAAVALQARLAAAGHKSSLVAP